ncbi:MAG: flavodoxin-dependent (E)-4-hydroxy-3-methylbut-2-enyl-diphosphate synthase [Clostridiales bacterium]|nr:flavodoxin-dependent (E)-4-hydroxy-3-methylbut-2-enyl-diphosphate synthase [Candidatus Equinaster intestinalis]
MYTNKDTKKVKIGNIYIGGGESVKIQSMLNVISTDIEGNVRQAKELEKAGCEIIRVSVPDMNAVRLIDAIKSEVNIPLVADIHFDYRLALESVSAGIDKIRINPGNIGEDSKVKAVADACRLHNIPIRIGVNSGSLEKSILARYGGPTAQAIVESGFYHAALLNKFDFDDIVLSLKTSSPAKTYEAYTLAAEKCRYPLHLGVTEAGTESMGVMKSAAAIGGLLLRGIGDTIRISLTDDPVKEVVTAKKLLKAIGFRNDGIKFVSCPTCGRTKIDLIKIAKEVEEKLENVDKNITVAIMGCVVNGPGEAREADIGIAGGDGCAVLFKKDGTKRKIPEDKIIQELISEIEKM